MISSIARRRCGCEQRESPSTCCLNKLSELIEDGGCVLGAFLSYGFRYVIGDIEDRLLLVGNSQKRRRRWALCAFRCP